MEDEKRCAFALAHRFYGINVFYRLSRLTGMVMHRAPPPPRGSSEPSMVMTYFL